MSFLRDIWADIVEKRLWPVVVVLVLALIAIPVALGSGGGSDPQAGAALPPTTKVDSSAKEVVSLATPATPRKAYGKAHDPFLQKGPKAPAPSTPAGSANAVAKPTTSSSSVAAAAVPTTTASANTTAPATTPAPVTTTPVSVPAATPAPTPQPTGHAAGYRVDFSFGQAGSARTVRDSVRLRALKSSVGPLAVFMGVRHKRHTAVFLLAPGSTATGDGRCLPAANDCQVLELHKGESEFFDVPVGASGVLQYELDVDRLAVRRAPTLAQARRARKRESHAGRKLMYALADAGQIYLSHYMYASGVGELMPRPVALTAGG